MGLFAGGVMLDNRTWSSSAVTGVTLRAVDPVTGEVLPTFSAEFPDVPKTVTTNGNGAYEDFIVTDYDVVRLEASGVSQSMVSQEVLAGKARSLAQPVATSADLPAVERDGSLRITQDDLHLWVWEGAEGAWTDLGSLRPADEVLAESYGAVAVPTGGDDTTSLNAILAANAGKVVQLRPGRTYTISDSLVIPSGTTLDGQGATIDAAGIPAATALGQRVAVRVAGSIGAAVSVGASIAEASRTVSSVADTSGFTVGDLVLISNEEPHAPGSTRADRDKGELNEVAGISGTTMTLSTGTLFDYGTTGLTVRRVAAAESVTVRNMRVDMGGVGSGHNGVRATHARDLTIQGVEVVGAEDIAVNLATVWNARVVGCTVRDSTSSALGNTGYGVAVVEGSRYVRVESNYFENCRHFVAGGGYWPAAFVDIVNNQGQVSSGYGYDCHEPCLRWTFRGNTAVGTAGGFIIRGQHITVDGNTVTDSTGPGIRCYTFDGVNEQRGLRVTGNTIARATSGIEVDGLGSGSSANSRKYDAIITDNRVADVTFEGILLRHFTRAQVSGNNVRDAGSSGVYCIDGADLTVGGGMVLVGQYGVRVDGVIGVATSGPVVTDALDVGIYFQGCSHVSVTGAQVRRAKWSGLRADNCTQLVVSGGSYADGTGGTADGIRIVTSFDVTINGTTTANPRHGVYATGSDFVIITGNNARNNGAGIKISIDSAAVNKVVTNNL